ncbi:MAG: hypothetical protein C0469_03470 [Cyanobacteria bacterium DS2.3.42]|nr:hypothetical protein [Cyanobacteria bacterium DS2.3.42]
MKTGTVTVRLPDEKIEQLQEMAKAQRCTVSDLVRKQILNSLESSNTTDGSSPELLKQLHDMETNLIGAQQAMADLLILILTNAVGTRYHASLATTYADDIITVMQTGNVLSEKEVERRQAIREKEARRIENAVITEVLGKKRKGGT